MEETEEIDYNEFIEKEEEIFCLEAEFWEQQIWEQKGSYD